MRFRWHLILALTLTLAPLFSAAPAWAQNSHPSDPSEPNKALETTEQLASIVLQAFLQTHDGYSVDEVLINPDLHQALQAKCLALAIEREQPIPETTRQAHKHFASALLHLRKTGQVGKVATRRAAKPGPDAPTKDAYRFAVEIAARQIASQHGAHTDDILVDPALRQAFLETCRSVCGDLPGLTDAMLLRDAINLRKARRLRPELVARIADWGKTISVYELQTLKTNPDNLSPANAPGVYIFRDATGYLYIGEAKNLSTRLKQHLKASGRTGLAEYLAEHADTASIQIEVHAFDPGSDARLVAYRRAYESDLIATRKPRFNVRP